MLQHIAQIRACHLPSKSAVKIRVRNKQAGIGLVPIKKRIHSSAAGLPGAQTIFISVKCKDPNSRLGALEN